jgi:hypothetical protein
MYDPSKNALNDKNQFENLKDILFVNKTYQYTNQNNHRS